MLMARAGAKITSLQTGDDFADKEFQKTLLKRWSVKQEKRSADKTTQKQTG